MAAVDVAYLLLDASLTLENSPVFQSQILDWIEIQSRHGLRVGIVAPISDRGQFDRLIRPRLQAAGVAVETFTPAGIWGSVWRASRALRRLEKRRRVRSIYVRSVWGPAAYRLAHPIGGPRLVFDFRGDVVAEARFAGRSGLRLRALALFTSWAIRQADVCAAVSSHAARILAATYGRSPVTIIPSCVEAVRWDAGAGARSDVRLELGIAPDELLLVYAGGLNRYQMVPEMLRLWARLEANDRSLSFLLLASEQPTHGTPAGAQGGVGPARLTMKSVRRDEVARYLGAADIGFLLRQKHPLNRVASPVKFGEYMAAGLAVIASPGLGDVEAWVRGERVGELADPDDPAAAEAASLALIRRVRGDRDGFRSRARALAVQKLDWEAYMHAWRLLLGGV